jgi:hypothetical protein
MNALFQFGRAQPLPKLQVAREESPAIIQRRAIGKSALYNFGLSG